MREAKRGYGLNCTQAITQTHRKFWDRIASLGGKGIGFYTPVLVSHGKPHTEGEDNLPGISE